MNQLRAYYIRETLTNNQIRVFHDGEDEDFCFLGWSTVKFCGSLKFSEVLSASILRLMIS